MLTLQDIQNVLQLIESDRLALRGNEATAVAGLIARLKATLEAAKQPPKEVNGDGARLTE